MIDCSYLYKPEKISRKNIQKNSLNLTCAFDSLLQADCDPRSGLP